MFEFDNSYVRRRDRLLDEREAFILLSDGEYGILSMCDDGSPYGIPVNYVLKDDFIYIHCAPVGRKIELITSNANVSFCVVGRTKVIPSGFTTEYESIQVNGTATIITDEQEKIHALELFIKKYSPEHLHSGSKYIMGSLNRTAIIRIVIRSASGKTKKT